MFILILAKSDLPFKLINYILPPRTIICILLGDPGHSSAYLNQRIIVTRAVCQLKIYCTLYNPTIR